MVAAAIAGSAIIGGVTSVIGGSQAASAAKAGSDAQAAAYKYAADVQKQIFEEQRSDLQPWRSTGVSALNLLSDLNGLSPDTAPVYGSAPVSSSPTTYQTGVPGGGSTGNSANPIWSRIAQMVAGDNPNAIRTPTAAATAGNRVVVTPGVTSAQKQQAAFDKFYADPGYQFALEQGEQGIQRSAAAKGGLFSGATAKALARYDIGQANQEYSDWYNRIASLAGVGQTATQQGNDAAQNYANNAGNLAVGAGNARASGYQNVANAWNGALSGVANSANQGIGNYMLLSMLSKYGVS